MGSTQERIKKRREYLVKKRGAYTKMSLATILAVPFTLATLFVSLSLPLALYNYFHYKAWADYNVGVIKTLIGSLLFFGVFAGLFAREARKAHRTARQLAYIPPVTADTLPDGEVLVRGSEEPIQEQSKVLLRGTEASAGTGEQELLRGSQGQ
ncbi:MAG TPA: hypothetical protein VFA07_18920 [Chthonomonadaceae bacterium]|nr:hypothetical protein [Chthonomonadaceae bacterium]